MLFTASLIVLAIGIGMLVRGLVGRRVGTEPRCRKCKYDLTNLTSDRCPECGVVLGPGAVRMGLRRRPRVLLIVGAALCMLGGALVAPATRRWVGALNWYPFAPTRLVIFAAEHGASRAFDYLEDRNNKKLLSQSDMHALIDAGLVVQNRGGSDPYTQRWVDYLAVLDESGSMTEPQQAQFLRVITESLIPTDFSSREGDMLCINLRPAPMRPTSCRRLVRLTEGELRARGRMLSRPLSGARSIERAVSDPPRSPRNPFGRRLMLATQNLKPGSYDIELDVRRDVYESVAAGAKQLASLNETLTTRLKVLSAEEPDPFRSVTDPASETTIRRSLEIVITKALNGTTTQPAGCTVCIGFANGMTIPAAFNLYLRSGNDEELLGRVHSDPNCACNLYTRVRGIAPGRLDGTELSIVLRPDRNMALNLFSEAGWYFGAEIVLGPFKLTPYTEYGRGGYESHYLRYPEAVDSSSVCGSKASP